MTTVELEPYEGGRRMKLDRSRAARYADGVSVGLHNYQAAARAGLAARSCERYLRRGQDAFARLEAIVADLTDEEAAVLDRLDDSYPENPATRPDGWPYLSDREEALLTLLPENDALCCRFCREVERALVACESRALAQVQEAAAGYDVVERTTVTETTKDGTTRTTTTERVRRERSWQAAMTILERRFPDRWSQTRRHEISGVGVPADDGGTPETTGAMALAALEGEARDEYLGGVASILHEAGVLDAIDVDGVELAEAGDDDDDARSLGDDRGAETPAALGGDAETDEVRPPDPDA